MENHTELINEETGEDQKSQNEDQIATDNLRRTSSKKSEVKVEMKDLN